MGLPLYPTTVVGSWPRPRALLRATRDLRAGRITEQEYKQIADQAVLDCLNDQLEAGIDIVSDGEQRRDNFVSFVAEKLENVRMLKVSELLDYIDDKASFEEILGTLDVPAYSLTNPGAAGPIRRRKPLALDEFQFLKQHTDRPVKVALPGPYLLTRSMWVEGLSRETYPTKEDLAVDVVRVLREEVDDLIKAGVAFIQFDEPVLTELVFTEKNAHRTFMCGVLTAKKDAEEELRLATDLINQVTDGFLDKGSRIGVHICRGNWSTNEEVLLKGPYFPLLPYLSKMKVDQLILEYATPRAGELEALQGLDKEIGLGVVNPRTEQLERPEEIVGKVKQLRAINPGSTVFLNPDCGFGTFAQRPMNSAEGAFKKLQVIVEAARQLRENEAGS